MLTETSKNVDTKSQGHWSEPERLCVCAFFWGGEGEEG